MKLKLWDEIWDGRQNLEIPFITFEVNKVVLDFRRHLSLLRWLQEHFVSKTLWKKQQQTLISKGFELISVFLPYFILPEISLGKTWLEITSALIVSLLRS